MKVTHKIPIREVSGPHISMWESVEISYEKDQGLAEINAISKEIKAAFAEKPQNTLSDKELTDYIYNSLNGIGNSPDVWETMHPIQKQVLKCYRNAQNRKKPGQSRDPEKQFNS